MPVPIRDLIAELEVVHVDDPPVMTAVLPRIRELLELDCAAFAMPVERVTGWTLQGFATDNVPDAARFEQSFTRFFRRTTRRFGCFDPRAPEAAQRNAALHLQRHAADAYAASALYAECIQPLGLARHHVLRMLVCEDDVLLGWLGGFSTDEVTAASRTYLEALAPALRWRLALERLLGTAPRLHAALGITIEEIGAPALVIDQHGHIDAINSAARVLVEQRGDDVAASIAAILAHGRPRLPFTITRLSERGLPDHYLAILRPRTTEARIDLAVAMATTRWRLTPRQQEVLALVVRGESNAEIAARLGTTSRAAELHITALFERAGVTNRAALVAAVLLG